MSQVINNTLLTTTGDTVYASSANTPARLAIGTTNQVLTVSGGVPTWTNGSKAILTTTGDILYASSANTPARLAAGTSGYILTAQGAGVAPVWAAAPSSAPSAGSVTFAMLANETKIMHIMQAY